MSTFQEAIKEVTGNHIFTPTKSVKEWTDMGCPFEWTKIEEAVLKGKVLEVYSDSGYGKTAAFYDGMLYYSATNHIFGPDFAVSIPESGEMWEADIYQRIN